MEGQQRPIQKQERHFPWIRAIVALLISLFIAAATLLAILSTGHTIAGYWLAIIPLIFSAIGLLLPLGQWLFPISPVAKSDLPPPLLPSIDVKISLTSPATEQTSHTDHAKQPTTLWTVPYQHNPFFTGRETLLKLLNENLISNQAAALTHAQAIHGLGGIGKTQIAVEYAYRHRQNYRYVFWARAATLDTLLADFMNFARLLHLPEQHEQDQTTMRDAVKRWLTKRSKWLLILDNADDLSIVYDFVPTQRTGHILLTTREQAVSKLAQSIEVNNLDFEEGILMLLRRAGLLSPGTLLDQASHEDKKQARAIVQEMGGLPLALDQAGAYIEETQCTLSSYLNTYRQRQLDLLKERGNQEKDHPESVVTTWSLSFEKVEQSNLLAADLLRCCAFLAPDAIPEELLTNGAAQLGPSLQTLETNSATFDKAIRTLRRFSFIRRNQEDNTLSIHRLVQAVLIASMNKQEQRQWAERITKAMSIVFPVSEMGTWPQCQRLLPQAQVCAEHIDRYHLTFSEATGLLIRAASYLKDHLLYSEAEPFLKRAQAISEQTFGPTHPNTASILNNLADAYRRQGKYEQAESLYQRALAIHEQVLGPNHRETASTLLALGYLYYKQGRYEQSEPLLKRALTICEQILGPTDSLTANSLNNLAALYKKQRNYEQAEPLYQRSLAICEQSLGPYHLSTAQSLNNLAVFYDEQHKYEQAEPLYQRALAIREQALGPNHPATKTVRANLAELLEEMKHTQK